MSDDRYDRWRNCAKPSQPCYSEDMTITVALPDDITQHAEPGREALEALALEGYRSGTLTQFQVGQLLRFSRVQTETFLASHLDLYDYTTEELEAEADLLHRLRGTL